MRNKTKQASKAEQARALVEIVRRNPGATKLTILTELANELEVDLYDTRYVLDYARDYGLIKANQGNSVLSLGVRAWTV
jgi:hypothetical protein